MKGLILKTSLFYTSHLKKYIKKFWAKINTQWVISNA